MSLTQSLPSVRSCPACQGEGGSTVVHSQSTVWRVERERAHLIRQPVWRRRSCVLCGHRWTTYEIDAETLDALLRP